MKKLTEINNKKEELNKEDLSFLYEIDNNIQGFGYNKDPRIEEILDKTVRPYLQGDGGDLDVVDYTDNIVLVNYVGACGTCPSSLAGTLTAIESTLRAEINPNIRVVSVTQ